MSNSNNFLSNDPFAYLTKDDFSFYPQDWFSLPSMRMLISERRWRVFHEKSSLKVCDSIDGGVLTETIKHNTNMLQGSFYALSLLERPELVLRPVMCLDKINFNIKKLKVLTIGPRSEYEILMLLKYGFEIENITGVDLISYSPWIDVADMHQMPYEDNTFDLIIMGWVLTYSKDLQKVIDETVRVAKNGAVFSIGIDYNPLETFSSESILISTTEPIINLFSKNLNKVYFNHYPAKEDMHIKGNIIVTLDIKKDNINIFDKDELFNQAKESYLNNIYIDSEKILTKLYNLDKNNKDVSLYLGLSKYKQNKYEDAINYLVNTIDLGLYNYDVFYALSDCLEKIGDIETSEIYRKKAEEMKE